MRIAIFADSAYGDRTGIGNYTQRLLSGLSEAPGVQVNEILPDSLRPGKYGETATCGRVPIAKSVYAWYPYATWVLRNRPEIDILHNPSQVPGYFHTKVPQVLTIHDLVPLLFPKESKRSRTLIYKLLLGSSIRAAKRIVTVSENTKHDIILQYGVSAGKITVIPLAAHSRYRAEPSPDDDEILHRHRIRRPYILYVGTIEGRKNLDTLIWAFSQLVARDFQYTLVLAGKRGWRTGRFDRALEGIPNGERVIVTGYVEDDALPALYRNADVFVYPSLYEGFGLPPLEAMACGTPVVCSSASSLPEVVGDAGVQVDPTDAGMLANVLEEVLTSVSMRQTLAQRGIERAASFSWERMIRDTLAVYTDVGDENRREQE